MRHSIASRVGRRYGSPADRIPTVCVVDPQADDFHDWDATATAAGIRLRIVASAEEALRFSRSNTVDLWVINTELPGLSGLELCSMLKNQSAHAAVYLVADEYSSETELAAWAARPTLFSCKPGQRDLLASWLHDRSFASSRNRIGQATQIAAAVSISH